MQAESPDGVAGQGHLSTNSQWPRDSGPCYGRTMDVTCPEADKRTRPCRRWAWRLLVLVLILLLPAAVVLWVLIVLSLH